MKRSMFTRRTVLATGLLAPLGHPLLAQVAAGPVVETASGKVRGFAEQGTVVFRGLPYGASTGGANRFRPPQPVVPWRGVREAQLFGQSSPQSNPAGPDSDVIMRAALPQDPPGVSEGEDCLVVNVWTPGVTGKRPVMVWLHGGGYSSGSASHPMYDGGNLSRRGDIVMVGVNHRLNVFGFTHLAEVGGEAFAGSGNAGILDIVQALQWVRANIAAFGGDPGNVTIFGESGGGAKVSTLLAMPAAKGLIHRAIIQSGPGMRVGSAPDAARVADLLAAELGLKANQIRELQAVPQVKLMAAYFAIQPKIRAAGLGGGNFSPVLDGVAIPRHPFDPDAPAVSDDVPLLIGNNRTEATFPPFMSSTPADRAMDAAGLRERLKAGYPKANVDALIAAYRQADPAGTPFDVLVRITPDRVMGANTILLAERKVARGRAPVYVYRFDWESSVMDGHRKAMHIMEVPFAFDNTIRAAAMVGTPADAEPLAAKMSLAWATFARTGAPAAEGLPAWPAYSPGNRKVMVFNTPSYLADDPGGAERRALLAAMG